MIIVGSNPTQRIMEWQRKPIKFEPEPEVGSERTIIKFLWFPTTIGLSPRVRWLEKAKINQIYVEEERNYTSKLGTKYRWHERLWRNKSWAD